DHLTIAPYEPLRARDGLIIVAVANPRLWDRFCDAIDRRDLRDDPRFRSNADRMDHRAELKQLLESIFEACTVDELTRRLQAFNRAGRPRGSHAPGRRAPAGGAARDARPPAPSSVRRCDDARTRREAVADARRSPPAATRSGRAHTGGHGGNRRGKARRRVE